MEISDSILVIGGGVAGLAAAMNLTQAGKRVTLIEASGRLGGRIHTLFNPNGFPIELGPEFVHGDAPLTKEFTPDVIKMDQKFRYFEDGEFSSLSEFPRILKKGFKKIDDSTPDGPMTLITEEIGTDTKEGKAFEGFVEGFFAADPAKLSKNSLAGGGGDFTNNSQARQGYVTLVKSLKAKIDPLLYEEELEQPVESIRWQKGKVGVRSVHGKTWEGSKVVITVPIELFKKLEFIPELPEKREAASFIDGGHVVKPIVIFKEQLWEIGDEHQQQVISPDLNFTAHWVWREAPKFQLTNWIGGARANRLHDEPVDVLIDLVLQDVSAVTGRDPSELSKLVDTYCYHDWYKDPWVKGAYSYVRVGGGDCRKTLSRPVGETLFFAGEATATDGSDGTVEGALKTGMRAAREILNLSGGRFESAGRGKADRDARSVI